MPRRLIPEREYFYTLDEEGRLWHAGTEHTDPAFLDLFFRRLRPNTTGRHPDHPYLSPCGRELNFLRPSDTPIVFTRLSSSGRLGYGGTLSVPFAPRALRVSQRGILYHPAPVGRWGRLARRVVLALADRFEEEGGRIGLRMGGTFHPLLPLEEELRR